MKTIIPVHDVMFTSPCPVHGEAEHAIILTQYFCQRHIVEVKFWCKECAKGEEYQIYFEVWHMNIWKEFMRNIDSIDN